MASRHKSRELAVQLVYQWDLHPGTLSQVEKSIDRFWNEQAQAASENRPFFEFLVKGVAEHLPYIDSAITAKAQNYRLSRIEKVDLAILRVAVFELRFAPEHHEDGGVDAPVVINEAIEISKRFGTSSSNVFLNGILDAISKDKGEAKQ